MEEAMQEILPPRRSVLRAAETLAEFRGNHNCTMLDEEVGRFNAEAAPIFQWNDHETVNNWYPRSRRTSASSRGRASFPRRRVGAGGRDARTYTS
jgi:phosphodiesterase/alkaline phosphatase D-like protein